MIEIDGKNGGGQMLRTALTLSAVEQKGFRIKNIRGSRPNPGLKRQHLECVKVVARLTRAEVEGVEKGSDEISFEPGKLSNESFTVNIGTAGSATLLLDCILPITSQFDKSFRIDVKGGTDVKWSPTLDYYKNVKLPLLSRIGVDADLETRRTGFYPSGGGFLRLETEPYFLKPVEFMERKSLRRFELYSKASRELESRGVAERQADEAARKLKNSHISTEVEKDISYVETDSPGSSLVLKSVYKDSLAGFDSLGESDKRSEKVAEDVIKDFKRFHSSNAALDRHMAHQIIVYLAIIGGNVSIPKVTEHVQTNLEVVRKFGVKADLEREKGRAVISV